MFFVFLHLMYFRKKGYCSRISRQRRISVNGILCRGFENYGHHGYVIVELDGI